MTPEERLEHVRSLKRERARRYRELHPDKIHAQQKRWRDDNPRTEYLREYSRTYNSRPEVMERRRKWSRLNRRRLRLLRYGITPEQYDALVDRQGGMCAICRRTPSYELVPDHDHTTGAIRGLLCQGCNAAIGYLGDTLEGVERAVAYLQAYELLAKAK